MTRGAPEPEQIAWLSALTRPKRVGVAPSEKMKDILFS
jgi:hypothetical protein